MALRRALLERAPCLALRWLALRRLTLSDHELGALGDELAARAIVRRGWRVIGRHVRVGRAEIDLLAETPGGRVVIEVKTGRAGRAHPPGERLGAWQLARLVRAGRQLGARRVDLIEVVIDPRSGGVTLAHQVGCAHRPEG